MAKAEKQAGYIAPSLSEVSALKEQMSFYLRLKSKFYILNAQNLNV